jgi:hypothetical protein
LGCDNFYFKKDKKSFSSSAFTCFLSGLPEIGFVFKSLGAFKFDMPLHADTMKIIGQSSDKIYHLWYLNGFKSR